MNIVYISNAGHTMEYAKLLSRELGINAYTLKEAKKVLKKKEEIIYLCWIRANKPVGLKKALKRYNLKALCTCGMTINKENQDNIILKYKISCPLFYLPGGFDINRLEDGFYKALMIQMRKGMQEKLLSNATLTDEERLCAVTVVEGRNYVSKEYLKPVIDFINEK